MSSGGGSKVKYSQSPEQRQIFNAVLPMYQGFTQQGMNTYFGGQPNLGAPSMQGVLTSQPMYNVPDASMAMPTANWYNSLAPEVMAGLRAPYQDASNQLLEQLGARGQAGSGQGGYSGAAGAALGEFWSDAAKDMGLNAWAMTSPAAMANWNAQLNRNINQYNVGQQEALGDYNTAMEAWRMPMQTMNYMGAGIGQAYAQPQSNPLGGALSGGLMGGLAGGMLPASLGLGPWGMVGGAALGGLAGLFS